MASSDLELPSLTDVAEMALEDRLDLLAFLESVGGAVAELRGAVRALLYEPSRPAALVVAKEAARRLGVSADTVRARGAEWGIEVDLGRDIKRYDPERIEALRQQRNTASGAAAHIS